MKKIFVIIYIFICCIMISTNANAKYIYDEIIDVADINIKITVPKLRVTKYTGGKPEYNYNIMSGSGIILNVEAIGEGFDEMQKDKIECLVNGKAIEVGKIRINKLKDVDGGSEFYINITTFYTEEEGMISIVFKEGAVIDKNGIPNKEFRYDTTTFINKGAPSLTIIQKKLEDGSVEVKIISEEPVKEVENWIRDETNTTLTKIYTKSTTERIRVHDYGGNLTMADIKVII